MIEEQSPIAALEAEHHFIRIVVGVMAVFAERLALGHEVPVAVLREFVEFMRTFGDRCHHGKEERLLFPMLEAKGVPIQGCPLGVLIHEHERGRTLVAELAQAAAAYEQNQPDARERLHTSLLGITELYPGHMWREEYLLFPMTEKVLTRTELGALRARFAEVESELGAGVHEQCERLAERLQDNVRQQT